jgi:hypothetical protein
VRTTTGWEDSEVRVEDALAGLRARKVPVLRARRAAEWWKEGLVKGGGVLELVVSVELAVVMFES